MYILFEDNRYIPCVGNIRVCGATGMEFQEDPFPESQESYKNVYCSSCKVLIVTDGSQNTYAGSS